MGSKLKNIKLYLFLFLLFILPLSAVDFVLVRPLLAPAIALWIMAALLSLLLFFSLKDSFKYHTGMYYVIAYFIYEIARDLLTAPVLRALFGDARGPFLSVFTSLSLMVVYITAVQFSKSEKSRIWIIIGMASSVAVAGIMGVLQHFGAASLFQPSVRAYATLSNPIELAGIGLLVLVALSGLAMSKKWMPGFIFLAVISCAIVATQSKIAVFVLGLLLVLSMFNAVRLRMTRIAALFIAAALMAFVVYITPVDQSYVNKSAFGSTELANDAISESLLGRQQIWKTSASIGLAKPMFGWGQADFPNTFTKYSNIRSSTDLIVFDAHNWIIDAFAKGGITKLALIIFILMFYLRKRQKDQLNNYLLLSIGLYAVFLLVNPSWLVSKVYLFSILGLISVEEKDGSDSHFAKITRSLTLFGSLLIVILTAFVMFFSFLRLYAEVEGSKGIKASRMGLYSQGLNYSKMAINIFPYEPDYWARLGWSYKIRYLKSRSVNDLTEARHAYERALLITPDDVMLKMRIEDLQKEIQRIK